MDSHARELRHAFKDRLVSPKDRCCVCGAAAHVVITTANGDRPLCKTHDAITRPR